ncbi:lysylphosphatidylglycerol synthase transmembrane domain-containing protein [Halomicrococcus sp. NG-SE-24]|uniref:lysylphosphatidylglycerol synthase transmembrane domain-containing protein n=1 Tax=Halomicrococcus sp. NG-SE-24 TaxID=3436928 RepID=UPI003D970C39
MSTTEKRSEGVDRSTVAKVLVGFAVAGAILYLFGRVIGWSELQAALADADPKWVVVACASTVVSLVFWSKAWDVILSVFGIDIPLRSLVVTYFAATFGDYVTPFGKAGGSPFVAFVLSTDDRATYEESLAGVLMAELLNLVPFFAFAAIGGLALAFRSDITGQARYLVWGLAGMAILVPALVYAGWRNQGFVETLVVTVVSPVAARTSRVEVTSIRGRVREFFQGVEEIATHPDAVKRTLPYAFLGWLFFALPLYFAGLTFGVHLDPFVVFFVVPASTVAGLTPTPGGLGGVEFAVVALIVALTAGGAAVSWGTAGVIALVYRVASYWFVLAAGGLAALYETYRA